MSFTLLSIVVILLFATVAFLELHRAWQRGLLSSLFSLGAVVMSLLFSLALAPTVANMIAYPIYRWLSRQSFYRTAIGGYEFIGEFVRACLCMAVGAFIFVLLLLLLRPLAMLLIRLLYKRAMKGEHVNEEEANGTSWLERNRKHLALVTGALCAVLLTMAITSPVMGVLDVARTLIAISEKTDTTHQQNDSIKEQMDEIEPYATDVIGNIFYQCGGKYMFYAAATTTVWGETVSLPHELKQIELLVEDYIEIAPVLKGEKSPSLGDARILRSMSAHVQELELSSVLLAEYMPEMANAWRSGRSYLGMVCPQVDGRFASVLDAVLKSCSETHGGREKQDAVTLLHTYAIFLECDIQRQYGSSMHELHTMILTLQKSGVLALLEEELLANPNMYEARLAMQHAANNLVNDYIRAYGHETTAYLELVDNLADAVVAIKHKNYGSYEEREEAMMTYTEQYFKDFGLPLEGTLLYYRAELLLNNVYSYTTEDAATEVDALLRGSFVYW